LKIKQINDTVLIYIGGILDYIVTRIQPNERTEIKQQQTRQKQFVSR
jgi:hypothetical protein